MALIHPAVTINTTFATKDIRTAQSVYTFTAAAAGFVTLTVKLTNAAGGGDYIIYLTHDWLGAAAASTVLPKTTCTAAAGETNVEFASMQIYVAATDVVNVMIDGLAGDNSVNGAIRIVTDNPSVFDAGTDVPSANVTYSAGVALTGRLAQVTDLLAIGGTSTYSYSNTVDDGSGNLLDGVFVQCATDTGFTNIVSTATTNSLGAFTVYDDVAGTHYLRLQFSGITFADQTVTLA